MIRRRAPDRVATNERWRSELCEHPNELPIQAVSTKHNFQARHVQTKTAGLKNLRQLIADPPWGQLSRPRFF